MAPKPKKDNPRSKQPTKCGYCRVSMRRDRLPQHTDDQHPGQLVKEYGDSSQTLVDMLA